jgi:hypothetical protein
LIDQLLFIERRTGNQCLYHKPSTKPPMKTKIQPFKPNFPNLLMMDIVLRRAVRQGFKARNRIPLPTIKAWKRDDVRETIKAYRMIQATEVQNVD